MSSGRLQPPYSGSKHPLFKSTGTQHLQRSGPTWFAANRKALLCYRQPALQLQHQETAWPFKASRQAQPCAAGHSEGGVLYSLQGPVLSRVGDSTADIKQKWMGLRAVPNIYISNLSLAAVTMATGLLVTRQPECWVLTLVPSSADPQEKSGRQPRKQHPRQNEAVAIRL